MPIKKIPDLTAVIRLAMLVTALEHAPLLRRFPNKFSTDKTTSIFFKVSIAVPNSSIEAEEKDKCTLKYLPQSSLVVGYTVQGGEGLLLFIGQALPYTTYARRILNRNLRSNIKITEAM